MSILRPLVPAIIIAVQPLLFAAPANDNFAAATAMSAISGSLPAVSTATATFEAGEPQHHIITLGGHSIWHRFTPTVKDRFTFTTDGSSFDTTMAAYSGPALTGLTRLASDDDSGEGARSLIIFTAGPGNPVSVAIDGYGGDTGSAILNWSQTPVVNDNFAAATVFTATGGALYGFTYRATSEAGEPNAGASVWYRWTATSTMNWNMTVRSPDMAVFMGAYTGGSVGALTTVSTTSAAAGQDATLSFNAVSGVTYYFQIKGSAAGDRGDFVLTGGDNSPLLPDIIPVASQTDAFMYGWNLDQTTIPGRTLLRLSTATANVGAGALELRGSAENPAVMQRIYNVNGTWSERLAGTFTFHPTHGHLHFDGWLQFQIRSVTAGNGVGAIIAAGDKTSFAILDLEHHNSSLPGSPLDAFYDSGLLQGISVGWRDVYSQSLDDQWIDVTNVPPGSYWLESVVDPDDRVLESDESNNTARIQINYAGTAPPNNDFASATLLTGATAADSGRNYSATKQSGEPNHAGNAGGKSVWYRWTAGSTGPVTVSTAGSNFDTLLGIYTGTAVNELTLVASNDDDAPQTTSRVTFNAVSGTIYRIAVDGKAGAAGSVEIAVNPALNNHFANALTVSGATGTASGSNRGATAEAAEPAHAGSPAATSIWYFWTATLTGDAAFTTEGSTFNARLAVYNGATLNSLTPVASSVGTGVETPATVTFHVDIGTGYLIAVDGGPGVLKLNWQSDTAIAPYVITHPQAGNVPQGSNMVLSGVIGGSPTLTYQWRFGGSPISDGPEYSGTNTPTLTVYDVQFSDSGSYTLTGTNPSGTVTTNPASIIILTNPRTVSIADSPGDIGGSVFAPIQFNATGTEHALQFTLTFNTAALNNGRVTAGPGAPGGTVVLDRSQEASGRIGVTLTLPGTNVFTAGLRHALTAQFDVVPAAAPGVTSLAFGDSPVVKTALANGGSQLPAVFDGANVTLSAVNASISMAAAAGSNWSFTVRGLRGKTYRLYQSSNLVDWTVAATSEIGASGIVVFTLPAAGAPSFYKAGPVP